MNKKANLTDLKKALHKKKNEALIAEIAHLYKTFPQVKEYYQASFFEDDDSVLEKYKQKIRHEFVPVNKMSFPKARLSVARKAISDYKKITTSNIGIVDIMLTYVESGVVFTDNFGDIDEPFYISMETMFEKACQFIVKENMRADFDDRLWKIIQSTSRMGWGFYDGLLDGYDINFKTNFKSK